MLSEVRKLRMQNAALAANVQALNETVQTLSATIVELKEVIKKTSP